MTQFVHLDSSEVFELFWCQWLFSQQKQYCSAAIPLALHLNQSIVHFTVYSGGFREIKYNVGDELMSVRSL